MAADLTLGVTIGAALASSWKGVLGSVRTDLSKLGQEVQRSTRLQRDIGQMAGLQTSMEGTRKQLSEARHAAEGFRLQVALAGDQSTKAQKRAQQQWEKSKQRVEALTGRLARQQDQTNKLGDTLKKAGVNTRDLSAANEKLAQTLDQQTAAFLKQKNLIESRAKHKQSFMQEAAKIGTLIGLTVKAGRAAISFESVMADVRKVVDFDTPEQFAIMGRDIREMSQWLGLSAEEIGNIVAAGGQANIARGDLLKFAEDAGKMGVAFDIAADEAGQMMAQWRTGLELSQDGVRELADQINFLGNTGPASAAKISAIVTRIGALGDVAGLSGSAIAALGSTITGVGISEEVAATGIKNLMLTLTQGTAATNKQKAALRSLGLDAEDMAARMQEDASGAIVDLLSALKDLDKEQQASTLTQLFGRESVAAIAPLLKNLTTLEENFRKVGDSSQFTGSMQKEFQSRMATSGQNLKNFGATLKNTAIIIGNVFLPPLNLIVGVLSAVFRGINTVAERFPFLTAVVVGATTAWLGWNAAVAASKFALTFLPGALSALATPFKILPAVISFATTAMKAFNVAMLMNPIVLIGAAMVATAFLIYKYWQPIKAFFGGFFTGLWEGLKPFRSYFREAFAPVAPLFNAIGRALTPIISWFKDLLSPVSASSEELERVASMGQMVGNVLSKAFTSPLSPIRWMIGLLQLAAAIIGKIMETATSVVQFFGFGESDSMPASLSAEKTINEAALKAPISRATGPIQQTNNSETKIEIYGAPGQSPEDIADIVAQKMAEVDRQNAARRRSALYDQE